jgi:transcriptional regulator with XRE-family HTH domain
MAKTPRGGRKSPLHHSPEAVRWARKAKAYKQYRLAQDVGITASHMCEIESGARNCPPDLLMRIAHRLNCPVSVLEAPRVPRAHAADEPATQDSAADTAA